MFAMAPWLQCRHSVAELERLLSDVSVILVGMQRIGGMSSVALQLSDGIAAFDRLYSWVQWCAQQLASHDCAGASLWSSDVPLGSDSSPTFIRANEHCSL